MLRLLLLLSTVFALLQCASTKACPSRSSIEQSLLDAHIPGATVVVVNATDILYQEAFGHQSLSPVKMMDVDRSIFVLASISKTFIAVAVMQLVEANQLDLDTDINQYLSSLNQRISHPQYPSHAITLRKLLSHSASIGINEETDFTLMQPGDNALTRMSLADACFTYLSHNASNWLPKPPGTVTLYSNIGTSLAGLVVERVTQMPYEHYVREKILKPLGIDLKKAGFCLSDIEDREELVKHYAFNTSYLEEWNQVLPQLNVTKVKQLEQLISKSFEIVFRVLYSTGFTFHSTA
jgi:CubicO group peptidase (beta-lactamase class C family)